MASAKKQQPSQFVEGHDPRRGHRVKQPPKPKQTSSAVVNAVEAGMDPDEALARVQAGQFKPGFDPRRPSMEHLAKLAPRPSVARAAARMAWAERIPWLLGVIDGVPTPMVRIRKEKDKEGKETGQFVRIEYEETPPLKERLAAFHELSEMTGVKSMSFTDGDGGDLPPTAPTFIFSNLSSEDLLRMEELMKRAQPKALRAGDEVEPAP